MQDTPANKILYSAKIRAANEFKVFMSADKSGTKAYNATFTESAFTSTVPIPSYLIAIAVGDLEQQTIGGKVGVITEPGFMSKVVAEFSDLPTWFDTLQKYMTMNVYPWAKYDILVLPPSFPLGGMENPQLTFASPTVIVGDKSQVYVAAHEMAHSWTGNTVTCADWDNFWLNEGFTVFLERKASATIKGNDFAMVAAYIGAQTAYENM